MPARAKPDNGQLLEILQSTIAAMQEAGFDVKMGNAISRQSCRIEILGVMYHPDEQVAFSEWDTPAEYPEGSE